MKQKTEADHSYFPDVLWLRVHETKEQQLKFENRLIGPFVLEILPHALDTTSHVRPRDVGMKFKSDCAVRSADSALSLING